MTSELKILSVAQAEPCGVYPYMPPEVNLPSAGDLTANFPDLGSREDRIPAGLKIVNFSPVQPRDESGKWTTGGGGGAGFSEEAGGWTDAEGTPLSDKDQARLTAANVPKAWTDVRLNPDETAGHQAAGRDSKGRLQNRYSTEHMGIQDAAKFARVKELNDQMPELQNRSRSEMNDENLTTAQRDTAAALYLVSQTGMRPGSTKETLGDVKAYGATTLEGRHVSVSGDTTTFDFTAKKGVSQHIEVKDADLARYISNKGVGADEQVFSTNERQLLGKMKETAGPDFLVKDLRTWNGTMKAAEAVALAPPPPIPNSVKEYKAAVKQVAESVASYLGNTPAVALKSYIAPEVFGRWQAQTSGLVGNVLQTLRSAVLKLIRWNFNPAQPRDEQGRFAAMPGGGGDGGEDSKSGAGVYSEEEFEQAANFIPPESKDFPLMVVGGLPGEYFSPFRSLVRDDEKNLKRLREWSEEDLENHLLGHFNEDYIEELRHIVADESLSLQRDSTFFFGQDQGGFDNLVSAIDDNDEIQFLGHRHVGVDLERVLNYAGFTQGDRAVPGGVFEITAPQGTKMPFTKVFDLPEGSFLPGARAKVVERSTKQMTIQGEAASVPYVRLQLVDDGRSFVGRILNEIDEINQYISENKKGEPVTGLKFHVVNFNPTQPRDERGRFAGGGGGGGSVLDQKGVADVFPGDPANSAGRDTFELYRNSDGSWTPERQALHDDIVKGFKEGKTPVDNPESILMGGGTAAGKSTMLHSGELEVPENMIAVDSDDIKGMLPEYGGLLQKGDVSAAAFCHEESSYLAKRITRESIDEGYNVLLDGTGDSSLESLMAKAEMMRAGGRPVKAYYATVPTDTAVARSLARAEETGRYVPESVIRSIHASVSNVVPQAIAAGAFDELQVWDTSGASGVKLASAVGSELTIHNDSGWKAFLAKGQE